MPEPETDSVLVMLTVPRHWRKLTVDDIDRTIRAVRRNFIRQMAGEIKRWQGAGVIDLAALRTVLEERDTPKKEPEAAGIVVGTSPGDAHVEWIHFQPPPGSRLFLEPVSMPQFDAEDVRMLKEGIHYPDNAVAWVRSMVERVGAHAEGKNHAPQT